MTTEIIIFGASLKGRVALDITNYIGECSVYAFADNSADKQKNGFMGLPVLSPEEAAASGKPILLASIYKYEMVEQLKGLGCTNYFFSYRDKGIELPERQIEELEEMTSYVHYYNLYELLYDFEINEYHSDAPVEKDKIVFCCDTLYQFFTCVILKEVYFKEKNCTLLAGNRVNSLNRIIKNIPSGVFERVVPFNFNHNITKCQFSEIVEIFGVPEKFIFFTDYFILTKKLMRIIPKNTISIMADEGLYFYTDIVNSQKANKIFDKIRVDELWGYNKSLFTFPKSGIPFVEIKLSKENLEKVLVVLNTIFEYTHAPLESDIIYFDYAMRGCISVEDEMVPFKKLDNILKKYNSAIKPHPSEGEDKYINAETPLICKTKELSQFPWELYEFNNIASNNRKQSIYVSLGSTAALFSYMFSSLSNEKNKDKAIFIYKIYFNNVHSVAIDFEPLEKLISRINDKNIFVPETFEELDELLSRLVSELHANREA